jgi:hypothetical protein
MEELMFDSAVCRSVRSASIRSARIRIFWDIVVIIWIAARPHHPRRLKPDNAMLEYATQVYFVAKTVKLQPLHGRYHGTVVEDGREAALFEADGAE